MRARFDELTLSTDGRLFAAGPLVLDEGEVEDSVAVRFLIAQGDATATGVGGPDGSGRWSGAVDTTGFSVGRPAIATGVLTVQVDEEGVTGFNAISWSVVLDIQEDGGRADEDDDWAIRAVLDALRQAERVTLHIDVEPRRAASANRAQRLSITRGRTAQDRSRYSAPTD